MLSVSAPECICLDRVLLCTMKTLLGSLLVLATFMTACNAECYIIPLEKFLDGSLTECRDLDGITHPMKSSWTNSHCEECFCDEKEMSCCNIAPIPADYDRSKCRVISHRNNCTYSVMEYKNPEKDCEVHTWVL